VSTLVSSVLKWRFALNLDFCQCQMSNCEFQLKVSGTFLTEKWSKGLIIWTLLSRRLVVATTTKQNLGHLNSSGLRGRRKTYLTILKRAWSANLKMAWYVLLHATSEAGARWPRFGLVVVAKTSRCDNKVQMIRPQIMIL
jgi:hypothetical protein